MGWKSNRVMWDRNSPYVYRNDNLRALGFNSYRAYLRSDLWLAIKRRVLDRDEHRCVRCRWRKKLQVHHRAYDPATLRGDSIDALTTVCNRCHYKAERPTDFTRSRYDRLTQSSRNVLRPRLNKIKKEQRERAKYETFAPAWAVQEGSAPST